MAEQDAARLKAHALALIKAYTGRATLPDPLPEGMELVADAVCARAAARATGEAGLSSITEQAGPYQTQRYFATDAQPGGPWLTRADKLILKRWRITGKAANVPMG